MQYRIFASLIATVLLLDRVAAECCEPKYLPYDQSICADGTDPGYGRCCAYGPWCVSINVNRFPIVAAVLTRMNAATYSAVTATGAAEQALISASRSRWASWELTLASENLLLLICRATFIDHCGDSPFQT